MFWLIIGTIAEVAQMIIALIFLRQFYKEKGGERAAEKIKKIIDKLR